MSNLPLTEKQRAKALSTNLLINEIFLSLQGETSSVGIPTVFIRLTGCPLRCKYCDTEYAFHEGNKLNIGEILGKVSEYCTKHVAVTGGEPLAQKNCLPLLSQLCDEDYHVSLETSGALDVSMVDKRIVKVLDLKTPGSGEEKKNLYSNLKHLNDGDEIKFVICNRIDYEWSVQKLLAYQLAERCNVLFSPVQQQQSAAELAEWTLEDRLPVRLHIQLHKYLWGDVAGH